MKILSKTGKVLREVPGDTLSDADLRGANLRGADLRGAYLVRADLVRADLGEADLGEANLGGADLVRANLVRANLREADLSGAYLSYADLRGANLRGAKLSYADLRYADLRGAYLRGVIGLPDAPVIAGIDAAILATIEAGGGLDMSSWHECETTHCRAGWAITLAGERGKELERLYGPSVAGALIYHASDPDRPIPDWHVSNEEALADMRERAGAK